MPFFGEIWIANFFNPRLTKGGCNPLRFFSKESDLGHLNNLYYMHCEHFDEQKMGYHVTRG